MGLDLNNDLDLEFIREAAPINEKKGHHSSH